MILAGGCRGVGPGCQHLFLGVSHNDGHPQNNAGGLKVRPPGLNTPDFLEGGVPEKQLRVVKHALAMFPFFILNPP